jgi:DNA polymerase I-like protein with 3'-5' exonuclease and polymerase domains
MLLFDIESNGLLEDMTVIHCLCISDGHKNIVRYGPDAVERGIKRLHNAIRSGEGICGHNIINFDIPAIQKLYPWFSIDRGQRKNIVDTLVMARLIYSNIGESDYGRYRAGKLPGTLIGSHKLAAWGYRLGVLKGTYAEDTEDAWAVFNEEMLDYNEQDVVVTECLYDKLLEQKYSQTAIELEHKIAWLMAQQERNGFPFDVQGAIKLEGVLRARAAALDEKIRKMVPPIPDKVFIPKRDNKTLGYVKGVPIQRYKEFNPNSRQQIEYIICKHYGYLPDNVELYAEDGRLKMDEQTFKYLKGDKKAPKEVQVLAPLLEEQLMISKRLGQLADGSQAWLSHVKADGRIHGRVNPNGAVTGRATHSSPNVAQVPHNGAPYGKECRALFGVPKGWIQAGIDACGLELRCLSHFLYPYDEGKYAYEVVHGDIHTANQKAAGLEKRDTAKTFIYAYLYGAGDAKIGKIVGGDATEGKRLKKKFLAATPAIKNLRKAIEGVLVKETYHGKITRWKRHYLKGLDGRLLHVRSIHSALNLLLQSAGALVCKYWIVRTEERLLDRGLKHGWEGDFALMAWIHDEQQVACRTRQIAEIVVQEAQLAMRDTQAFFNFRCQLDTEGIIGHNWEECH